MKGIANIILSMVMGKLWGIMGVLVATTVTSATTLFWYEPKILYGYFKKSIWNEVLYHIITILLLAISFGLTYLVVHRMQGTGMIYLLYKGVICLITQFHSLYTARLRDMKSGCGARLSFAVL